MYRVNAFTQKGVRFRFRIRSHSIDEVQELVDTLFGERAMRLILVEALSS